MLIADKGILIIFYGNTADLPLRCYVTPLMPHLNPYHSSTVASPPPLITVNKGKKKEKDSGATKFSVNRGGN